MVLKTKIFSSTPRYLTLFLRTWRLGERHEAGERAFAKGGVAQKPVALLLCKMGCAFAGGVDFPWLALVLKRLHGVMRIWEASRGGMHWRTSMCISIWDMGSGGGGGGRAAWH